MIEKREFHSFTAYFVTLSSRTLPYYFSLPKRINHENKTIDQFISDGNAFLN